MQIVFEGRIFSGREKESVLDTLLRGGADVPYSCRKGSCHTCLLQVVEGDPGSASQRGIAPSLIASGHFKPCVAYPRCDLHVARADFSRIQQVAQVSERDEPGESLVRLRLELSDSHKWRPGQRVRVLDSDNTEATAWISSLIEEDYFLDILLDTSSQCRVTRWLAAPERLGEEINLCGPFGVAAWREDMANERLLVLADATAAPAALSTLREALREGQRGQVSLQFFLGDADSDLADLLHRGLSNVNAGAWTAEVQRGGIPADDTLRALIGAHLNSPSVLDGGSRVIVLGHAAFVEHARVQAQHCGAERRRVHALPHTQEPPEVPTDGSKVKALEPDPQLWAALGEGVLLRQILEEFYGIVFEDERLAPFFHQVTKERAIDKQYSFLKDVFSGSGEYFGLRPYNAHHWMVISDELFDYREALFEGCLRRAGLEDELVRRWNALHERFRSDIVKSKARGLYYDGREHPVQGYSDEVLTVGSVCDGCATEMPEGSIGRMQLRTGKLYCVTCGATQLSAPEF